jgi:5-methylcytosine-specific restriction enzyme A
MAKLRMLAPRVATLDTRIAKPPPKVADRELLTQEHKAWRQAVIARAHGRCQDPEHKGDRFGHRLVADHVLERRDRPDLALDLRNGRASCWACHTRKTNEERAKRMRR